MVDAKTFRDAMSRLAAAVSVVTTNGPGGLSGCTASAVCSVTDEPPVVLVCINRASRNNAIFKQNGQLCINVLRPEQQDVAMLFARSSDTTPTQTRFVDGIWSIGESAAPFQLPALINALVSLECSITDTAEVGSHTVFYCRIEAVRFGDPGAALLYYERSFHTLANPLAGITEHPHPR